MIKTKRFYVNQKRTIFEKIKTTFFRETNQFINICKDCLHFKTKTMNFIVGLTYSTVAVTSSSGKPYSPFHNFIVAHAKWSFVMSKVTSIVMPKRAIVQPKRSTINLSGLTSLLRID